MTPLAGWRSSTRWNARGSPARPRRRARISSICGVVPVVRLTEDFRLCAAWRKTSVRRTTGTMPLSMMFRRTVPGPTGGAGQRRRPRSGWRAFSGCLASGFRFAFCGLYRNARNERTDQAASEAPVPEAFGLIDLIAFQTMLLAPIPRYAVLGLDAFPVRAGVLVMIDLAVLGWILR